MKAIGWMVAAAMLVNGSAAWAQEDSDWVYEDGTKPLETQWYYVGLTGGSNRSVVWIESQSKTADTKQRWTYFFHEKAKKNGTKFEKRLQKFDCYNRTIALASWVDISSSGDVVGSETLRSYSIEYEPVVPDSIGATMLDTACNGPSSGEDSFPTSWLDNASREALGYPSK